MDNVEERVLILTSTKRDSESTYKLLDKSNLNPFLCNNFEHLLENIQIGAGALLLAKEVLVDSHLDRLMDCLNQQESWSDLPITILASTGDMTQGNYRANKVLKALRNTTILERPIRIATLISVLESSLINRKRQYEVRNLVLELMHARKEAELSKQASDRANQAKSEFLANMSHEIRTPLGVILGFTDLASDDNISPEDKKHYFSAVQRNGQLLLALVNDILDLSKVEAGHIQTEALDVSVLDIVKDVIASFAPIAAEKKVDILLRVSPQFPNLVKTDPTRVRQIFMNMLSNAVKFTKHGYVSLELSSSPICEDNCRISLIVTDTGMGISEQQRQKLFKPFSQADSSTTRKFGGTGLGLVLSKQLARALGGDLKLVGSIPGVGSKFEATLIVNSSLMSAGLNQEKESLPTKELKTIQGLKVLLAEDSPDNQVIITRILNIAGASVELANDGNEVIEKAMNAKYDVILMDIQMPYVDGNEATKRLRSNGYKEPIIALTANALKGDKERALAVGFNDYITKPIQRSELLESLGKYNN